jgi:GNAT superfamily N-acetyltransferase
MENIKFISNADFNCWKNAVKMTSQHENWIFTEEDYNIWSNGFGPKNFNLLVAVEKNSERIVGHIAYAFYGFGDESETIATSGTFFVLPEYRKTGVGLELTLRMLKDPRAELHNKAVVGVAAMTKKYAMLGLNKYPDWRFEDMEAKIQDIDCERLEVDNLIKTIPLQSVDLKKFICYDSQITGGIRRDGFIKMFLESKNSFSKVAIDPNGNVVGYGNIRIGSNNQLAIGPLYADSSSVAETLLKNIFKSINDLRQYCKIFYYPSSTNSHAKQIFFKLASNNVTENENMFVQFSDHVPKVCFLTIL